MLVEQAYTKFLIKVDDNFETSKIAVDRGRFVIIFNESQNKLVENILDRKSNDEIRYIQKLLVKDFKIANPTKKETADYFPLPENYFDFSSAYSKATKKGCDLQKIYLYEIKDDNSQELLNDEFNKPSFLAREAPFTFSSDNISIFKGDINHKELYLSYYRYPTQISLKNNDNPESPFDESKKIDFDDKFVDRIISMAVSEMKINYGDQSFQINKQQSINKF